MVVQVVNIIQYTSLKSINQYLNYENDSWNFMRKYADLTTLYYIQHYFLFPRKRSFSDFSVKCIFEIQGIYIFLLTIYSHINYQHEKSRMSITRLSQHGCIVNYARQHCCLFITYGGNRKSLIQVLSLLLM